MSTSLPSTHRAVTFHGSDKPIQLEAVSTPQPTLGSVTVRILAASVDPGTSAILSGYVPGLTLANPSIPGQKGVGRVAAIGPDTTTLAVGQLVLIDPFVRARDDSDVQFIMGVGVFGNDPRSIKLMQDVWSDGVFAEYARLPLENCHPLDEKRLVGSPSKAGLGYSFSELTIMTRHIVPYGGLRSIGLTAGETIIIAPATGGYSGAAVEVASAMGARVIAVGRNLEALQKIAAATPRVEVYQLKGNVEEDTAGLQQFGTIDAYLDLSPHSANESTHVKSCFMALRSYGRAVLMGIIQKDIAVPYMYAAIRNLTIRCQYMYSREDVRDVIKLVQGGMLKLGKPAGHHVLGELALEEWEKAMELAQGNPQAGSIVVLKP